MKITDIFYPSLIKMNLNASSKEEVINELAELIDENGFLFDKDHYIKEVIKREALGSTGVGMGVAIPHGKSRFVKEACVAFGKSQKGINFGSSDGSLAHLIFLIAVPEDTDNQHLKILATLSRMLIHQEFREDLLQTNSLEEVMQVINSHK